MERDNDREVFCHTGDTQKYKIHDITSECTSEMITYKILKQCQKGGFIISKGHNSWITDLTFIQNIPQINADIK